MLKSVAVILLNWNTPEHTKACINSLNQYCNTNLFDIIVADNGSTDGSLTILQAQFTDVVFIDNKENLGFAEGNNRALQYTINKGYTYSMLINTDTLVDEDIITALTYHLDVHPEAAAVQPAVYWMHDKNRIWNGEGKFNAIVGLVQSDKGLPTIADMSLFKKAKWVTGCCMLLRNNALQKSGLLNKHFFLYFEDVELSYRLRANGFMLHYLPSVKIYHEAGVSAKASPQKKEGYLSPIIHYYISRNHIWFLRKYGSTLFLPLNFIYNGSYYLLLLIYFLIRGRKQKASFLIKGIRDGLFAPKNLIWTETDNLTNSH